ncbi:MAG: XdhC family protein [Spirochaetota bacterium]
MVMEAVFRRIADLIREGKQFAVATIIDVEGSSPRLSGTRMLIFPEGKVEGTIGGGALEKRVLEDALRLMKEGGSKKLVYDLGGRGEGSPLGMMCGGMVEVFIETFKRYMSVFIFGAGHIGKKLAQLCGLLGITHWVIDNREEYARRELFPDAAGVLHLDFAESFRHLPIDERSYIIIVTYGHQYDGVCLEEALKTRAVYIGMIGSRSKVKGLLDSLKAKGVDADDPRIYAPVGLHLGDSSPEQISISIIAEIIKINSDGSGKHMRDLIDQ